MPVIKDPRHERFAQALAKGMTADEAYVSVGYKRNRGNAARLKASESIRKRVAELTEKSAEKATLTKSWVIERLMRNAMIAMGDEKVKITKTDKDTGLTVEVEVVERDPAAANKALELLGKTLGVFIERKEIGGPGDFDRMSDDELRDFVTREASALGLGRSQAEASGRGGKTRGQLN